MKGFSIHRAHSAYKDVRAIRRGKTVQRIARKKAFKASAKAIRGKGNSPS